MSEKVFISYRSEQPDAALAEAFYEALTAAGISTFMAARSIRMGDVWSRRIDEALRGCGFFLLLLSPLSADSEMVIEEVRQARALCENGKNDKPVILPVRVNIPWDYPLNYDLRGYLQRIQQGEWRSPEDTAKLVKQIAELAAGGDAALGAPSAAAPEAEGAPAAAPRREDRPHRWPSRSCPAAARSTWARASTSSGRRASRTAIARSRSPAPCSASRARARWARRR